MTDRLRNYQLKEMKQDDEMQQQSSNLHISNVFDIRNIFGLRNIFNPMAGAKHIYVDLQKDQADLQITDRLHWSIALQGTGNLNANTIYLQELPSNIICVKLVSVVCVIDDFTIDFGIINNGRLGILIDELQIQSSTVGDNKLHFLFKPEVTNFYAVSFLQNSNICNFGAYWFNPPILSLPSITFSVFNPVFRIPVSIIGDLKASLEIIYYGGDMSSG